MGGGDGKSPPGVSMTQEPNYISLSTPSSTSDSGASDWSTMTPEQKLQAGMPITSLTTAVTLTLVFCNIVLI